MCIIKEGVGGWVGSPVYMFIDAKAIPLLTAKQKYKIQEHKKRWERRYDKEYPTITKGYIGNYSGVEIIID